MFNLYAQAQDASASTGGNPIFFIILIAFLFLVMIPSIRRNRKAEKKRKNIIKGDKVLLNSGVIGLVKNTKEEENILVVEVSKNVTVDMYRSMVADVIPTDVKPNNNKKNTKKKSISTQEDAPLSNDKAKK